MNTIALFDDDPTLIDLYTTILQEEGYEVLPLTISGSTDTLLTNIRQLEVDLLIIDIRIPGVNTFEIVKVLQAEFEQLQLKIMVCSAARNDIAELIAKLTENGLPLPALVEKPFDLDEFVKSVKGLIEDRS